MRRAVAEILGLGLPIAGLLNNAGISQVSPKQIRDPAFTARVVAGTRVVLAKETALSAV